MSDASVYAAVKEHQTLSELCKKRPDIFTSVVNSMIDKAISKSKNPTQMRKIQDRLKPYLKTEKEVKFESSLQSLQDKFNQH